MNQQTGSGFVRTSYVNVPPKAMSSRVIIATAGFSTYCLFSYFACDLTARMTAGPAPLPLRNFQDVVDGGYQATLNTLPAVSSSSALE